MRGARIDRRAAVVLALALGGWPAPAAAETAPCQTARDCEAVFCCCSWQVDVDDGQPVRRTCP